MHNEASGSGAHGRAHLTKVEARARKAQVGRVDYSLDLEIPAKSDTYRGHVTVDFDLVGDAAGLFLDFQGRRVVSSTVNDEPASLAVHHHRIALPAASLRAGRNRVVVSFENPFDKDGSGLHKATDPSDGLEYVFSDCEPFNANRFFPCFDQPDLKATFATTVTAPADWTVVANGVETAVDDVAGGRRHRFGRTDRFSTYVVAVVAGPFRVLVDPLARIPARILVRQSMAAYADADEVFELTRQGFDFFEKYFGIPYAYVKYDQVFVPDYNAGAMENVACVVHSDRLLYRHAATERERRTRAITVLHEMAHMWFGDLVTMEWWDDLWLNESFATYLATLALVRATRFKDGFEAFRQEEKRWAYWQDELPTTHPIATDVSDTVNAFANFDGITYGKGASVLKQLSFFVGEEAFRRGVSTYLKNHAHGNARLADFLAAIGEAAGKDLGEWSASWLRTSGVNGLVPHVRAEDGRVTEVRIEQTAGNGDAVLRPHRVRVASYAVGGAHPTLSKTADVVVDGKESRVPGLAGTPSPAFLVVNHEDHAYAKAYLDDASLAWAKKNLERLPDSFLRTEVWSTVHMMVRDQQASPADYVDLFVAKAGLESNDKLIVALHRQVKGVLDLYLSDALRTGAVDRVHEVARRQALAAPKGSDLQRAWFDVASSTSETTATLDRLAAYLDGAEKIDGLVIDPERRWGLVTRLGAFAHPASLPALERERAADRSERGERAAFRAKVARPDAATKTEAWSRFRGEGGDRLDLLREGMGSFQWPHQREILRPFIDRYFEDLGPVTSARDLHFGAAFVNALYPGYHVESATLDRTKAFLDAKPPLSASVRRGLVERMAELDRALKVRAYVG